MKCYETHNQSKFEIINITYNIYLRLEKELQQRKDEIKLIRSELDENEKARRILKNETERKNTELGKSEDERRNLEAENKTLTDQMKCLKSELQDVNDARENLETEYKR